MLQLKAREFSSLAVEGLVGTRESEEMLLLVLMRLNKITEIVEDYSYNCVIDRFFFTIFKIIGYH